MDRSTDSEEQPLSAMVQARAEALLPSDSATTSERRLVPKPAWVDRAEHHLARRVPVHPHLLSAAKLVIVTPLMAIALRFAPGLWFGPLCVAALFAAFLVLDYLDGAVARHRQHANHFGRAFDRATDYPMLVVVSSFCLDVLPTTLLLLKLSLDLLLLVLYVLGRGTTENRIRTTMSYATLVALLVLSQAWLAPLVSPATVTLLISINIAFSATVVLHNLDLLHRRRVADALSVGNLLCGVAAMVAAVQGRLDLALLLVMAAMVFDGLDGTAARRWGSSRRGVYMDDAADAVSFALAPAVAVFVVLGGVEGATIAVVLALCAIGRLVFFTLNKSATRPGTFQGAPSPVGAVVVFGALNVCGHKPSLVGFFTGVACVLMVSFGVSYRHLGRAIAERASLLALLIPAALVLFATGALWGARLPATILMAAALVYGLLPTARAFRQAILESARRRRAPHAAACSPR